MTYKLFKQIIDWQIAHSQNINKLYDMGINFTEAFDEQEKVIDALWKQVLTTDGDDWVSWYLYEKNGISGKPRKDITADDNGKEICKDLKGTYNYLIENKYFKN